MPPLSHGQAALWFLSRMTPGSAAHNLVAAARVVLPPGVPLDAGALRRVFGGLAERHPELRATFSATAAGTPVKRIHERLPPEVLEVNATGWSEREIEDRLAAEASRPFDLAAGPLLRAVLLTGAREPYLLIALHHIAADFWSLGIIARELGALYDQLQGQSLVLCQGRAAEYEQGAEARSSDRTDPSDRSDPSDPTRALATRQFKADNVLDQGAPALLTSPRADYDEHVRRERALLAGPRGERLWRFWSEHLSEAPDLELPSDRPRPPRPVHRGGSVAFRVDPETAGRLRQIARGHGATLFATLLAGFQVLLSRTAGQTGFVVGAPSAGRSAADLAGTVGYFVQPLALRADLSGSPTVAQLLDRTRRTVRAALAHQALPFALLAERLRPVRVPGRSPLFQVMLVFHQARRPGEEAFPAFVLGRPGNVLRMGETLALDPVPLPAREVPFDLTLILAEEADGGLAAALEFSADLFDDTTARRLAERSTRLLAAMAADPSRGVEELPLAGEPELHQVLREWNDAAGAPGRPAGPYERFAAQARRTPEAVALVHDEERLTYQELDRRARSLAAHLRRIGVGPERVVGVRMERGPDLLAALLGVLAAGGAYLPLDPAQPRRRLEMMQEDSRALLTLTGLRPFPPGDPGEPAPPPHGSHLAYVIYTSGSTGRPKGVAVTHASVSALLDWAAEALHPGDVAGLFAATSIGFDLAVFELFAPLAMGGTVILGANVLALHGLPAAGAVTLVNTVPSAMAELLRQGPLPPSVRVVGLAGEPLPAELARRVRETIPGRGARVLNLYGPTEDTVYSTGAEVDGTGLPQSPPIGRPLPETRAYVLDAGLRPVPIGSPGELWLAGAGLARGYLHRPGLTAERFLPDPFGGPSGEVGGRLYRTGDRARLRPDGVIDLVGRIDHQVKVRGVRIELGEVEAVLLRQPSVRDAAAGVREVGGSRVLVAWVVRSGGDSLADLRAALTASLPSAMVPSVWLDLPALPRTPSGKVDRHSLPAPERGGSDHLRTAPRDPVEEALAAIWCEALGIEAVGVDESFFDLGGHSLLAMRLVARVRHVFGVELPVQAIFEQPTIARLARAVVAEPPRPAPPLAPVPRVGDLPLSHAQERLWFLDRLLPGSAVYNMPGAYLLRGPLRPEALAWAFGELARRHEVLRTRFVAVEGWPVQVIDPPLPVPLPCIDLSGLPGGSREAEARRLAGEESRRPFDLERGPLLRTALVRQEPREHRLLVTAHHIAADGWSMGLMAHEVAELVRAAAARQPAGLPELPVQYADYARWQRDWISDEVLAVQLAAWRDRLAGAPVRLDLPTDRPRPAVQSFTGARRPLALPAETVTRLHALGRGRSVSPFIVLAASLQALLGRLSGSDDLLLGIPVANRRRIELEPLIGLFVNTLVLRGDLAGDPAFAELLERVWQTALAAYLHQDLPFEKLVEELAPERSLAHSPLVQVLLVLQNAAPGSLELPGLEVRPVSLDSGTAKLDLTVELAEDAEAGLAGWIEYRSDLFDSATIDRLAGNFAALVAEAVAAPEKRLSELSLLAPAEQRQLTAAPRVSPRRARREDEEAGVPRTPTEEMLAQIWGELLGRPRFGPDDDFFEWGGHSLLGTLLVSRLRQRFGVEIQVRELFEAPTLAELAERVDAALGRPELAALPPIEPIPGQSPLPLSFAQQRLWLLDRLQPGGSVYNMPLAVRLDGPLDVSGAAALERALAAVIERHETLRTRFAEVEGVPVQEAAPHGEGVLLPRVDLAALPTGLGRCELSRLLAAEAERPFDLATGPVVRAFLAALREKSVLALNLHHIAADGWSIGVLVRELGAFWRGEELPALPIRYGDFAVWQRRWLQGEVLAEQLGWWRQRLEGVPPLELPTDRPRPAVQSPRGRQVPLALDGELWRGTGATARRLGATPFMALLAALQALLGRWTGQTDFAIGFPVANRRRPETEGLIGLFVNTLVLRGDLAGDPSGTELLRRTRDAALGAYAHQDLPFEKLVEELRPERDLGRNPFFQVMLALNAPLPALEPPAGLGAEPLDVHTRTSRLDQSWLWRESGGGLAGALEHSSDLFDATTALRMAGHFERLLSGLAADPERRLSDLPLLSDAESAQLAREWNDTGEVPATVLPALIARQTERAPEAVALVAGTERLTYGGLAQRAAGLAGRLLGLGVAPGDRVAVCLERSADLVAALLAVWKTGAAYVPLDPAWPAERLAWMLADSGAAVILGRRELVTRLEGPAPPVIDPAGPIGPIGPIGLEGPPLQEALDPQSLAYVIYTSGSTGRPKGVAIEHGSAAALALWAREVFAPDEIAGVLAATSVCFDLSVFELFVPLSLGGTVILAENALALPRLPAAEEVTLVNTVPSAVAELIRTGPLPVSVRTVCLAGEALRRDLADRLLAMPNLRVLNLYGPSEDTTYSTFAVLSPDDRRSPPIGRPLAGTRVYLCDAAGRQVPPGAAGEIRLAGVGLARGYLGRPDLTAAAFVPDPLADEPGARLYRTGDLGRVRTDGSLEFLGRIDRQIKVRGFRVEPGEVEAALVAHPAVREAAVVLRDALVAWLTLEPGSAEPSPAELRDWLLAHIPEPLVPGLFAMLDALPLTPSGKVDHLALARRPLPGRATAGFRAPRTPLEDAVAAIWSQTLDIERVGLDDDFFALGGHSLLAARVVSRLRGVLGIDLPLRALFEAPTVERLAHRVETARRSPAEPPLVPTAEVGEPPLSFAQERLWFLDRLDGGSSLNMAAGVRLTGDLDVAALAGALAGVERRHAVLRAAFPEDDGRPRQILAPIAPAPLPLLDLAGLPAAAGAAAGATEAERLREAVLLAPFDLASGPPWRALLLRSAGRDHELLVAFHHIVTDGWSLGLFTREVAALYAALATGAPADLPEPPIQYTDFARWQRGLVHGGEMASQLAFWRERLGGDLPAAPLSPDRPRATSRRSHAATVQRTLPPAVADALRSLGRAEGASLYMVLLAALGLLLGRHGGGRDVVVGSPVAGRTRPETEEVLGCFLNTLALRLDLGGGLEGGELSCRSLVAQARDVVLEALAHQDVPFERVLEEVRPEREAARTPLFQVLLNMLNFPRVAARLPGLELELLPGPTPPPRFDLTVYAEEREGEVRLSWVWDADLFEPETREEVADQLGLLLEQIARDPDVPLGALSLVTARGVERLPDPTAAIEAAWHGTVQGRFALQARQRPDTVAVTDHEAAWTYGELLRRSRGLAWSLEARGVQAGNVVAILAHRGAALVQAVLAVLEAGAVFLILDRDEPAARRAATLQAAAAPKAWLDTLDLPAHEEAPETWTGPDTPPDAPAYLAFTSGSTGAPKGISGTQRPLSHFLDWHVRTFGLDATDRFSLLSGLAHDPLLRDLFTPLWLGAALAIPDAEKMGSPGWLADWMAREEITTAHLTPVMSQLLTGTAGEVTLPALRRAFFGGDALHRRDTARLRALAPEVACVNFYGATETPQAMGWHAVAPDTSEDLQAPPLGRGIDGVQLLVLTATGRPAGIGEAGEVCIRTPYLALGYLDDPALTRARFLPNPFLPSPPPHDRLYRTGDLGAYLPDGQVRPLGRADRQIKIRGFRVEPAEVEAALARQEGVRQAFVTLRGDRLTGYVVPAAPGTVLSPAALRSALRDLLPPAMVPAGIAVLPALPLTRNGKVDLAALPDPEREDEAGYVAPRDPIEEVLAEIWAGVLGVERVGAEDEFFALGGHSLLATQVVSRVREACGVELPLRALFEASSLAALARRVEEARRGAEPPAPPAPPLRRIGRDGDLPLSFAQERLWFLDQMEPGNPNLHLAAALRLSGPLDAAALAAALRQVVHRHEALRATFGAQEGRPRQILAPAPEVPLPLVDLQGLPPAERQEEVRRQIPVAAWSPFDLARGPLLRALLLRLDGDEHALLLTLHHIVSDGWSTGVLFEELTALYEAFRTGRPSPLPELPVQYVDFAGWQRSWLHGEALAAQVAAWREMVGTGALTVLELPTDRPRPAVPSFRGARRPVLLPRPLATALHDLGRQHGATLFMVLMAAFQTLLHRSTGQDELLVGSPVANRTRVEVERLIGMFFNLLVFRAGLADDPAFAALLGRVRETALTAYLHQDLPFEKLLEELQPERDLSRTALVQVTLVLQNAPRAAIELPGLTLTPLEIDSRSANFDLNLQLTERPDGIAGWLEYRTDLFDAPTIDRMAAHLGHLLEGAVSVTGQRLSHLPLLSPGERFQLLAEWNDTRAPFPAEKTLPSLFAEAAVRTPEAVAVLSAERSLTYRELDEESARLARHLRSLGVGPGVPVAVLLERTADMAPALLGILRAGGFYVPLETGWPEARLATILSTLAVPHLLTQSFRLGALGRLLGRRGPLPLLRDVTCVDPGTPPPIDDGVRVWTAGDPRHLRDGDDPPPADPDALAYVIFTSGSTGVPKGVMVQHRPVVNLIHWVNRTFGIGPEDRLLFVTSLAFDLSVYDLFGILAAGGAVRVAGEAEIQDPEALACILCREPITFWDSAPAALARLVPFLPASGGAGGDCGRLRNVFLSGDWIPLPLPGALREAFQNVRVTALGGATEATIWSNSFAVGEPAPHWVSIPYGRPIPNARYHVLDAGLEPCPIGVAGDLYISGGCLSSGYVADPGLTAAKYLPDPWGGEPGGRLYRTGDGARFRPDGNIELLGRVDRQVKVRGFRIELGEIEAALLAHPAVRDAVVTARADDGPRGDKRLVGYVVQDPEGHAAGHEAEGEGRVDRWQVVYDDVYGRSSGEPADPTLNLAGWISSYTGEPLPEAEMRGWVDATVERILEQAGDRGPGRLLELGCGTGMLLLRLAPYCRSCHATDLSEVSLHYVRRQLEGRGLAGVTLERRTADVWSGIEPGSFDAVVLNSVTQHFPGVDYLRRVVEGAVRAVAPGGFVFVGDVRSLPLLRAFHASVQLWQAPDGLGRDRLGRRVRQRAAQEEELLVDPAFFSALGAALPGVERVEVQLKRGRDRNEMSRFRFDAVLRVGSARPAATPASAWLDWPAAGLSLAGLRALLATDRPALLGLRHVPDGRLHAEAAILEWLEGSDPPETAGELRLALERMPAAGVEPEDLWSLGRELGYVVEVRSAGAAGRCDALFRRAGAPAPAWPVSETWEVRETDGLPWHRYANDPLQGEMARQLVPRLRAWLAERLPEPMIPAAIVPLEALPLTANGKVDRAALPAPDSARAAMEDELVTPRTPAERLLAAIWAEVLGVEQVGVHDNFFGLGGDSILSIQVIARAQQAGLRLTPRQLFQHQTVAELAAVAEKPGESGEEQGAVTGEAPLTPIQRWFFEQELADPAHYNLAVMLELLEPVRPEHLDHVAARLLEHHDALRLRFRRAGAGWVQEHASPGGPVPAATLDLSALPSRARTAVLEATAAELQKSLDLEHGPLQRFVIFHLGTGEPDRLLLTVHHLVIDGVSWRILLEDLQTGLRQLGRGEEVRLPPKTTSYRRWSEALARHAGAAELAGEADFWLDPPRRRALPLPGEGLTGANLEETARTIKVALDAAETWALLREVPPAFQTRIDDVLLTALVRAFARWTGHRSLLIDLEGHGRGEILPDLDLSRTVGWFTAIYPVLLEAGGGDAEADLKSVKEQLRRVPAGGAGYGLLRYATEIGEQLARLPQAEVIFNDLGQFDSLTGDEALFRPARESFGATRSPRARRRHLLEIYATILDGRLELDFEFSANVHREPTIQRLAGSALRELRELIERCRAASAAGSREFTPSDFPEADLDQEDLDLLLEQMAEI